MRVNKLERIVRELTANAKTEEEKARAIFYFVRDKIEFDLYLGDLFHTAEEVVNIGKGSCVTKATLVVEMIRFINIPVRYHFVLLTKEGLRDILHPFVYKFWPDSFIHIYADIKLGDKWIDFDATYDKEFHHKLIEKGLNFGADQNTLSVDIDFSSSGVKSAQDLYTIRDAGCGDDLRKLNDYLETLPFIKKLLMPFAGWLSRRQVSNIRKA